MSDRSESRPKTSAGAPKQVSRWNSRWMIGAVLLALAVIFILENRDIVSVRLIIPLVLMPQWAALTLTLVIGFAIGVLVARRKR